MVEREEDISRHKRWMETSTALLGAVDNEKDDCYSIPVVPHNLRKSNETAYMPKVVSIGPRYKGKRELLPMEEIKWRCVTSLLSRVYERRIGTVETVLETVRDLDAFVRASYVEVITLDMNDLATTMVFDGCFLLELLICESALDLEVPIPFGGTSPGIDIKKMEYVISDLILVENQIPFFILETLFEKLLGLSNQMREFIQNLALPLFGFSGKLRGKYTFHFLDVIYSYLEMGWVDKMIEGNEVRINLGVIDTKLQPQQHLNRCATRLKAVGITIVCLKNDDNINFKCTTHFDKSKEILQIPQIIITQTTEVTWRSFIAWEHHKKKLKTGSSSDADRRSICTSSALLFRDLICRSSDVQLLKDREVIVDQSNKSNRDLVAFFHSIAHGVDCSIVDHNHITMFHDLSAFRTKNYATKIFILLSHYFLGWCYGIYNFSKHGYNLAAAILSLLTVIQTCYAVLAYHYPKQQN